MNQRYEVQLTEKIRQHFNEDELREICFRLKIGYEDLPGSGRAWKARELVLFCERKKRLEELTTACNQIFPQQFEI